MSEDGDGYGYNRNDGNDDDDFDFDPKQNKKGNNAAADQTKGRKIENNHYDEEVNFSEDGSEVPSENNNEDEFPSSQEKEDEPPAPRRGVTQGKPNKIEQPNFGQSYDDDEDQDSYRLPGGYNPNDFANLNVDDEVRELFQYITRFKPVNIDLETSLKAFIPDYIPAVGEVDAFLKPNRPDSNPENLGLITVDEPKLNQSRKRDMDLIAERHRVKGEKKKIIHSIERADLKPKEITDWIDAVNKNPRQAPTVVYSKQFPDIDNLMQVWPQEIEDALQNIKIPTEDIDLTLAEYSKLACALVDIPVHNTTNDRNLIESLHVMFTLYSEFRANQHFQNNQNDQFVYGH